MAKTLKDTRGLYAKTAPVVRRREERVAAVQNRRDAERSASRYGLRRQIEEALHDDDTEVEYGPQSA